MIDLQSLRSQFVDIFGKPPRLFRAPGRINLIGEHTDHNDGFVLPAAIDKATYIAAAPRTDRKVVAESLAFDGRVEIDLDETDTPRRADWGRYVQGVALLLEAGDFRLCGVDLLVSSDIPLGAGLSSSAALEVASGFALTKVADQDIDLMELARISRAAEHKYGGVMSGIMDQFTSAHGRADHALFLDCRSLNWTPVPLSGAKFVVCNTRVRHDLADSAYNQRRMECDQAAALFDKTSLRDVSLSDLQNFPADAPENLKRRARHVVTEDARVLSGVEALRAGDLVEFGRLIDASHESLRDDYEVSCPELNMMVEIARHIPGTLGSRMMGGGFGGCTINLIDPARTDEFEEVIGTEYQKATGVRPEIYAIKITDGVSEIRLDLA